MKFSKFISFSLLILLTASTLIWSQDKEEKPPVSKEQQEALDSLIKSLEILRANPESLKMVFEWFDSEKAKYEKEMEETNQQIAKLEEELKQAKQRKEGLERKLVTLASGKTLLEKAGGKTESSTDEPKAETAETKQEVAAAELFTMNVMPIFEVSCIGCHTGNEPAGGINLSTYEATLKGGKKGAAIVAGKPEESLLFQLVAHTQKPVMPAGDAKLSDENLELIAQWIRAEKSKE